MCHTRTAYALALSMVALGSATLAVILLLTVSGLAFEDLYAICRYYSSDGVCLLSDHRKTESLLFSAISFLISAICMGLGVWALATK